VDIIIVYHNSDTLKLITGGNTTGCWKGRGRSRHLWCHIWWVSRGLWQRGRGRIFFLKSHDIVYGWLHCHVLNELKFC